MKGQKTGGRKKGVPNKRTVDVLELINTKYPNFNPITDMVDIAKDQEVDINIRINCLKEIASYMFPKRKAIEVEANITERTTNREELSPALSKKIEAILNNSH